MKLNRLKTPSKFDLPSEKAIKVIELFRKRIGYWHWLVIWICCHILDRYKDVLVTQFILYHIIATEKIHRDTSYYVFKFEYIVHLKRMIVEKFRIDIQHIWHVKMGWKIQCITLLCENVIRLDESKQASNAYILYTFRSYAEGNTQNWTR